MAWNVPLSSLITAAVAFLGIAYGARLTGHRETLNWTREQRLRAYSELFTAIDNCYSAFTLLAATLVLHGYSPDAISDLRVKSAIDDWGKWDAEIDRCLPLAELVASERFGAYLTGGISLGLRTRHRILIMQLTHATKIDPQEWEHVARSTHGAMREIRWRFRGDLTQVKARRRLPPHLRRVLYRLYNALSSFVGRAIPASWRGE